MIIHGDTDPTVPLSHGEFHHRAITGSEIDVVPAGSHIVLLTHRRELTPRIAQFIDAAEATIASG